MRHLFIINPAAGKKSTTPQLERLLEKLSFPHEVAYTTGEGDARHIAHEAVRTGEPIRIYACGGDGTLNEVVNGAAGYENAAVTCIPKGTGNDFLKVFGPDYRSLFYDIEALAVGEETELDLMDCNGKLGLDVVCAGVDARIAADVHRYKNIVFAKGIVPYCLSLLENVFFKGIARPMKVEMGDISWDQDTSILCICNGRHYGGGFMPIPEAMPDDGVLDMLLVKKVGLGTFLRLLKTYATGGYRSCPELIRDHHGQTVTYSSPEPITTVVDGEVMVDTRFVVKLSEKKLRFFYPKGASYAAPVGEGTGTLSC